jgi:hypothetical protein
VLCVRFAIVSALCLALTAFAAAQTLPDRIEGQDVARKVSPVSLRLSRPGPVKLQAPASPQSFVFAVLVSAAALPAPQLPARFGDLPSCSLPSAAALAAPSCRAPPFA